MALWTDEQNKRFEQLLAVYDEDTPDRWQNVAQGVGKSVEDVKRQYRLLEEDIRRIEAGGAAHGARAEEQRIRYIRI